MDNSIRIQHLKDVLKTYRLTHEQKESLETAIKILNGNATKDQLIGVAKILATLLTVGAKIFHT